MEVTDTEFEKIVEQAIDNIPDMYAEKLQDIIFKTEHFPNDHQRQRLGLRRCDALFGLYEGVPLTKRGGVIHGKIPDVITIFKHPMVDMSHNHEALRKQVYKTVWHEVAHFFGLNHADIHAREK
jgi:predicted Zn-dependent protease with MMP-like domain